MEQLGIEEGIQLKIGERVIPENIGTEKEYVNFLFHLFCYNYVLSIVPLQSTVLDLGCGDGYGTKILAEKVDKIIGLDTDPEIIVSAKEKYGAHADFTSYNGGIIPHEDSTFDIVISFQVIEHVTNVDLFLGEIQRVLKSKGVAYISTPNRLYRLNTGDKPWNIYHLREYSPDQLDEVLTRIFPSTQIHGIRGSDEMERTERNRVKVNKQLASLDFLSLRTRLPMRMKIYPVKFLSRLLKSNESSTNNFIQKYSVEDVYLSNTDIKDSIHLFATCSNESKG